MKTMKRFAVFTILLAACAPAFSDVGSASDMLPKVTETDVVDVVCFQSKPSRDIDAFFWGGSNRPHRFCGDARFPVPFSDGLPALLYHVGGIVLVGPQEEMSHVDARSYVASVTNEHPVRDRTVCQFPGYSMRGPNALGSAAATSNHSVPTCRVCGPGPEPARIGLALGGVTSHAKGQRGDGLTPLRARPGTVSSAGISSSVKRYSARTNLGNLQSSHMTSSRSFGEKRGMERQLPRVSYFNMERS